MTIFTLADVLAVAKSLPEDLRNTQYDDGASACRYSQESDITAPDCLVGQITFRLDPALFGVIAEVAGGVPDLPAEWRNRFEDDARVFLGNAQSFADAGNTWGESVDSA